MSRVALHDVEKMFGPVRAVRGVSFEIHDGAFVTLLGPSGCGKTTTLNLIAGLETPTRGEIFLDAQRITDWAPHERRMAMVFQNYALYPHMNVYGNMAFSLKLAKQPRREIDARVRGVARALEIDHLLERRVAQLSGGQQQRVALARAMVKEPQVFLFDEPLSNLDAALRARMRSEIKRLHQRLGATSIFVTHDQEEAMMLSDYIAVMRDGLIVQYASADEIYRRPQHLYVATFIGKPQMSTVAGRLRASPAGIDFESPDLQLSWPAAPDGGATSTLDTQIILGIRAEDVRITAATGTPAPDQIVGAVSLLEPLGSDTFVEVNRGGATLTGRVEPDRHLRVGDAVSLTLPRPKLHCFDAATGDRITI
jgi:multiple sugar transport system ATP-binding protein